VLRRGRPSRSAGSGGRRPRTGHTPPPLRPWARARSLPIPIAPEDTPEQAAKRREFREEFLDGPLNWDAGCSPRRALPARRTDDRYYRAVRARNRALKALCARRSSTQQLRQRRVGGGSGAPHAGHAG